MQLNDFKNVVCYYQLTTVNLVQSVLYLLREFKVKVEWTNPGVWGGLHFCSGTPAYNTRPCIRAWCIV